MQLCEVYHYYFLIAKNAPENENAESESCPWGLEAHPIIQKGIDEYESTPSAIKKSAGKPTHDTVLIRGLILNHLCDELETDRKDVSSALKAARISTRQALHEGWPPS